MALGCIAQKSLSYCSTDFPQKRSRLSNIGMC
ncbi:Uncharacterised protein [Vibrio cholerae]|nr:Uncharacterised protein [Vibrio cholerae]CSI88028.1 Uncharacterised protein [Vibrio cholerae]